MARGLSSTHLPGAGVRAAADAALYSLKEERALLKTKLIQEYRINHGSVFCWFARDERVWAGMPYEIKKIVELHRVSDEATISALLALAKAAVNKIGDAHIDMTADDFRLIAVFYT